MIKYMGQGGFILADTCMEEYQPWLRPEAARYIERMLPKNANVFEWGCGASTVWLARQGHHVHSLELNREWYQLIEEFLEIEGLTALAKLHYFGKIEEWDHSLLPDDMEMYADAILCRDIPDLDLVIVDGRNRNRCLANSLVKIKVGGMLCLDNSERIEYAKSVALLDTWDGFSWGDSGWMTTVWHRLPFSITSRVVFPNEDA